MISKGKKFFYRIFCILALLIAIYLLVDLKVTRTLDPRILLLFLLLFVMVVWGIIDWKMNYDVICKQEEELKMYQLYIQPLEELVKEIRARQHEFDNHMNAVLNMHLTVDNYEELVERQSLYIKEAIDTDAKEYLSLLRISDKILAGFLYSKIISAKGNARTILDVRQTEIVSKVSEHDVIEMIGILIDNAYEACTGENQKVIISLDSIEDRIVFEVKNEVFDVEMSDIQKFFVKGWSTKEKNGSRGLGLYRAKQLADKTKSEITASLETIEGKKYISFHVMI